MTGIARVGNYAGRYISGKWGQPGFHIFGALAEFEREIIRERTKAGLQAAWARGRNGGRPKKLTTKQIQMLQHLAADKKHTVKEICRTFGIGRTAFYRYVTAD
jgi:DNA invertase Pin-like site-specific DNA recombinase